MFTNKHDPVADSVRQVMSNNDLRRRITDVLNEELGITSRNALPHEQRAQYDSVLEEAYKSAMEEEKDYSKDWHVVNPKGYTVYVSNMETDAKSTAKEFGDEYNVHRGDKLPENWKGSGTGSAMFAGKKEVKEEKELSPKQKRLAMLGTVTGKGGQKHKIDEPDLEAARKGHAHKVGLEEKATEAQKEKVAKVMHKWKQGEEHIGKSEKTVPVTKKGQKQAVAIALSQAGLSKKSNKKQIDEKATEDINENVLKKMARKLPGNPYTRFKLNRRVKNLETSANNMDWAMDELEDYRKRQASGRKTGGLRDLTLALAGMGVDIERARSESEEKRNKASRIRRAVKNRGFNKPQMTEDIESIMEEIRENLEEQLMEAYATGDSVVFENFVLSLTEEQREILGLNEQVPDYGFGLRGSEGNKPPSGMGATAGVTSSSYGGTPSTTTAPAPQPQLGSRMGSIASGLYGGDAKPSSVPNLPNVPDRASLKDYGGRPAGTTPDKMEPPKSSGYIPKNTEIKSSGVAGTSIVNEPATGRPNMPAPSSPAGGARAAAEIRPGEGTAPARTSTSAASSTTRSVARPAAIPPTGSAARQPTPAPRPTGTRPAARQSTSSSTTSSAPKSARDDSRPIAGFSPNVPSGQPGGSKWGNTFQESTHIRESLESFIRNKFLKG